jgi:hypothetical protein
MNKNIFSFVHVWDNVIYVNSCFSTLIKSKANSSNNNPSKQWMVLTIAS